MNNKISKTDEIFLKKIRANVELFMQNVSMQYAIKPGILLDIAPQDHLGATPFFSKKIIIETLDIDPNSGATYIVDLCDCSPLIGEDKFDYVVCTEVLEHTLQPFHAVDNIYKILKPGGYAFITTPFNFRIHGPLPDCWRFTEHGLRELFKKFNIINLNALDDGERFLMPVQYTMVVQKNLKSGI
jgi:SAM-dependent methyltransferase